MERHSNEPAMQEVLKAVQQNSANIADLAKAVNAYATHTESEIAGVKGEIYGLKGEITGIKGDISGIKGEISEIRQTMTTKEDLKWFATKEDLKEFATKADLKGFATKEDLKWFATKADLKGFATKEDLAEMREEMATKAELTQFKDEILTAIDGYAKKTIKVEQEQIFALHNYREVADVVDRHEADIKKIKAHVGLAA